MPGTEVQPTGHVDWESDLANLLGELTSVQTELLSVLEATSRPQHSMRIRESQARALY